MENGRRYGDLVFDPELLLVVRDGEEKRLTRNERALLQLFTRNPHTLLTRSRLLDAISHNGSEISDRNIDFLVNRIRTKLGDKAREPRYIATQYGEGYVWIAEREDPKPVDAFLVVGPVFGLSGQRHEAASRDLLARLRQEIDGATAPEQRVMVVEKWRPHVNAADRARFFVEASFFADHDGLHCALILRDYASRRIVWTIRRVMNPAVHEVIAQEASAAAEAIVSAIWHDSAAAPRSATPTDEPLELRIYNASKLLTADSATWLTSGKQLARARAENPEDPETALMWGMHLYALITMSGPFLGPSAQERAGMEAEIERLVFEMLPRIQDEPYMALAAAKLLFFVDRGHLELVEDLAARAFSQSTAFAASFSILGQIRMAQGSLDEAVELYDRGIELSDKGSEFHVYLMVLRSTALLASGNQRLIDEACDELFRVKPDATPIIGVILAAPDAELPPQFEAVAASFTPETAPAMIEYVNCVSARHFRLVEHRRNVLRGLCTHLERRLGPDVVPEPLRALLATRSAV